MVIIIVMELSLVELVPEIRPADPILLFPIKSTIRCTSGTILMAKKFKYMSENEFVHSKKKLSSLL